MKKMGPGTLCVFLRENYVMQNTVKVLKLIINPTTMSDDLINQLMSDIMEEEFNFILERHNISQSGLDSLTPLMHKRGLNPLLEKSVFTAYDGADD